ncbi:hypothetical protein F4819DRAFT_244894 [Hypoxylon fuscum]|nr:hypothetical protein F4819DRAFT_244894 [Hypoxylon fuscum]
MHFTSVFTSAVAVASTGAAAVLPRKASIDIDAYVGDLRTFTTIGCDTNNQGVGTFTHSMTSSCIIYAESFSSIYIHMTPGFAFRAHVTHDCRDQGTLISETLPGVLPITCNNQTHTEGPWVAYSVHPIQLGEL